MTITRPPLPPAVGITRFTPPRITPATVFGELTADGKHIVITVSGDPWVCKHAVAALRAMTPQDKPVGDGAATLLPLTWPTYMQLACAFTTQWSPGGRLREWFLAELTRRTQWMDRELRYQLPPGLALREWQPLSVRNVAHLGCLLEDDPRLGKALDIATPMLTTHGWTTMGKLRVGDEVYGPNGHPTQVINAYNAVDGRHCYRVSTTDGRELIADGDHLWTVRIRSAGGRHKWVTLTTSQMHTTGVLHNETSTRYRYHLPEQCPIITKPVELPIEPYTLGVWLGDGKSTSPVLTFGDEDVEELCQHLNAVGTKITFAKHDKTAWRVAFTTGHRGDFTNKARALDLLNHKHIPIQYLTAGTEQRLALLQGLLDTDGHIRPTDGWVELCTIHEELAKDTLYLIRSLGWRARYYTGKATLNGRVIGNKYRIYFAPKQGELIPFRLQRRIARIKPAEYSSRHNTAIIKSIEEVPSRPVRCITVENADGLYLAGIGLIPTHNSASAIVGLAERACWPEYPTVLPVVVVCPASVVTHWVREFQRFAPHWRTVAWRGGNSTRRSQLVGHYDVYVASYATARRDASHRKLALRDSPLSRVKAHTIIADEYHWLSSPDALQTKATQRLVRETNGRNGLFIPLSGTPFTHNVSNAHPTWEVFEPKAFPSRERLVDRWLDQSKQDYGQKITGINPLREAEFRACFLGRQLRRSREDVAPWLSTKTYSTREIPIPDPYRKMYRDMERKMLAELDNGDEVTVMSTVTKMMRLQQLAASACDLSETITVDEDTGLDVIHQHLHPKLPSWKVDALLDVLAELEWPALAFGISRPLMELAGAEATRAGARVGYVIGGQRQKDRDRDIDAFQAGKLDLLCVVVQAGGTGLTLNAAGSEIFLQRPCSFVHSIQAEDRGVGDRYPTLDVVDIVAEKTVDLRIREILHEKAAHLSEYFADMRIVRQLFGGTEQEA